MFLSCPITKLSVMRLVLFPVAGMSKTYMLCSHKYNVMIQASANYDLLFENPIGREAGAFWIQYSGKRSAIISTFFHF